MNILQPKPDAARLDRLGRALLDHLDGEVERFVDAVRGLAAHESPSRDKPALDALATRLEDRLTALGGAVQRVANPDGGDHLVARFGPADGGMPPGLLMGHFDTVWPTGTLAHMPIHRVEGRLHGPGVYDMKASLVLIEFALRAIAAIGETPARPLVVLFTSDEEIGSPTSRSLIEQTARASAYALVPEPPLASGALKTARKGVGRFELAVTGRAAHAGVEPEKGISAVVELAHQVLAIQALNRPEAGTTLNVGIIRGGTTPNVVPASSNALIDARATSIAEAERLTEALQQLAPVLPGALLSVSGGFNRPPMERTPAGVVLFERARDAGRTLGLDLAEGSTGGGSDGNFTAAVGTPTLDGLGLPGDGAHADYEHILVDSIPARVALFALLLLTL